MASSGRAISHRTTASIPSWRPGKKPWARAMAASASAKKTASVFPSPPTIGAKRWPARWPPPGPISNCSPRLKAKSSGSCALACKPKPIPVCACQPVPSGRWGIGACKWVKWPSPSPANCFSRAWAGPSRCLNRLPGGLMPPPRRPCNSPQRKPLCWCAPPPANSGTWAWVWCCPPASAAAWPVAWAWPSKPNCPPNPAVSPSAKAWIGNGSS